MLHPLTLDGFVAWAQDRVKAAPIVEGKSNSVELELAHVLHQFEAEDLHNESSSDLRAWLADILLLANWPAAHTRARVARLRRL